MVGAKSSCKERWRQVAFEADRVRRKHLVTLEPAITAKQTEQMHAADVQLVIPADIHPTYSAEQRRWLWSIGDLVTLLQERQAS